MALSSAQVDLLRHISQATETWARAERPARSFVLLHLGGLRSTIDHPGWDSSWPTPSEQDIDDLAELGLLRVEPLADKQRTFVLSVDGAAAVLELTATPAEEAVRPESSDGSATRHPSAFVSWAHDGPEWEATVYAFVQGLYANGIAAEIDLFHLNDPRVNWADYGPRTIESTDHVLIAVSGAYKRRWDGTEDPTKGAGAASEANTLKSIFGDDRDEFLRKVKIVVLPGASEDDIPLPIKAVVQRFPIDPKSQTSFEDLVRTLTGQPAFARPTLATIPNLPPRVAEVATTPSADDEDAELIDFIDQLRQSLEQLGNGYLRTEHAHLYGVVLSKVKSARPDNRFVSGLSEPEETAMSGIYRPTASEALAALTAMRSALRESAPTTARPEASHTPLDPTILRGRIFPNQFAASVSASEQVLAIRAAIAGQLPEDPPPMIDSSDEQAFLDLVAGSSLEAWAEQATTPSAQRWRSIDPTSSSVVTLRRPPTPSLIDGWEVECRAFLTVTPYHWGRPAGHGFLIIDVLFRPTGDEGRAEILTLHDLFELLFVLPAAVVDQIGTHLFERLSRGAGSNVLSATVVAQSYGLPLGTFVELHKDGWSRAEGSHDRHGAEWEPTEHAEIASSDRRAHAIREWLKKLLRDSGIRGHEAEIEAMPAPGLPTLHVRREVSTEG